MAGRLPEPIIRGQKLGFNVPMSAWLAGPLREFVGDVLSPARLARQGLLAPRAVERLVREHLSRTADHSHALWTLLVLGVWHDEVLTGTRAAAAAPLAAVAEA
jgi:asparagine synthase (glutamine-hydrolysing)